MSGIRKYCDIADEDIQLIAMCKRERRAMREELKVLNKIDSNRVNKIYADERAKLNAAHDQGDMFGDMFGGMHA